MHVSRMYVLLCTHIDALMFLFKYVYILTIIDCLTIESHEFNFFQKVSSDMYIFNTCDIPTRRPL